MAHDTSRRDAAMAYDAPSRDAALAHDAKAGGNVHHETTSGGSMPRTGRSATMARSDQNPPPSPQLQPEFFSFYGPSVGAARKGKDETKRRKGLHGRRWARGTPRARVFAQERG